MDAFEQVVKSVLEGKGYWVRQGYKVELSKEEKVKCGRSTSPRWEIDLIAFNPTEREVLAVECKSFLDSGGVSGRGFAESSEPTKSRFKLFNEPNLRNVVLEVLLRQLAGQRLVPLDCKIRLALAVGRFPNEADREAIRERFNVNQWRLFDDVYLREGVASLANRRYEDDVATVVAKLIINPRERSKKLPQRRGGKDIGTSPLLELESKKLAIEQPAVKAQFGIEGVVSPEILDAVDCEVRQATDDATSKHVSNLRKNVFRARLGSK